MYVDFKNSLMNQILWKPTLVDNDLEGFSSLSLIGEEQNKDLNLVKHQKLGSPLTELCFLHIQKKNRIKKSLCKYFIIVKGKEFLIKIWYTRCLTHRSGQSILGGYLTHLSNVNVAKLFFTLTFVVA